MGIKFNGEFQNTHKENISFLEQLTNKSVYQYLVELDPTIYFVLFEDKTWMILDEEMTRAFGYKLKHG